MNKRGFFTGALASGFALMATGAKAETQEDTLETILNNSTSISINLFTKIGSDTLEVLDVYNHHHDQNNTLSYFIIHKRYYITTKRSSDFLDGHQKTFLSLNDALQYANFLKKKYYT